MLKDALGLRCRGMMLTHGRDDKGEWLKASYFDEDGTSVDKRSHLRPHQRTPGVPLGWQTVADVVALQLLLRHPDFVVARERPVLAGEREAIRLSGAFPPRQRAALNGGTICPPRPLLLYCLACIRITAFEQPSCCWVACSRNY